MAFSGSLGRTCWGLSINLAFNLYGSLLVHSTACFKFPAATNWYASASGCSVLSRSDAYRILNCWACMWHIITACVEILQLIASAISWTMQWEKPRCRLGSHAEESDLSLQTEFSWYIKLDSAQYRRVRRPTCITALCNSIEFVMSPQIKKLCWQMYSVTAFRMHLSSTAKATPKLGHPFLLCPEVHRRMG